MKFEYFNPVNEKGSCIQRSISKVLDKDYFEVKNELIKFSKELNKDDFREIEVFEKYLFDNDFKKLDISDILVRNLNLKNGKYIVFCFKDNGYHMIPIIDSVIYDKSEDSLDLIVIKVYKLEKEI